MHQALQNLEVISTISSYVEHRSLPALASTCRAFAHPALNALWRDLQSAKPLVKCLPSDLFGVDRGGSAVLRKPLDDRMWHTLFKYTSRVHSIIVSDDTEVNGPLCLLAINISCFSAPESLFPNLHRLKLRASGTLCAAEVLRMAFVPSLVELNMEISSASSAFLSVLSSLGTFCPHLQNMTMNFGFSSDTSSPKVSPFITRPISQLHHLRTLSVSDLGVQGIKHLTELPTLQSLSLHLTMLSAWETKSDSSFPGFHNLHFLGLFTLTIKQASNFLNSLQFVESKEIEIKVDLTFAFDDECTSMPEFFAIVREKCDNTKLESISFHGLCSKQSHTRLRGVFTPLYACCNLTRLLIGDLCYISMSDEELGQLAKAWPKLQVLQIKCYASENTTIPTFHGLINLLRRCPALTSLALVINVTQLNGIDLKSPGGGCSNQRLTSFALGRSLIQAPVDVALITSGLFPDLKKVDFWDTSLPKLQPRKEWLKQQLERWELVNKIIGGFSLVKERCIETWSDR